MSLVNCFIPSGLFFQNISHVLDAYGASIYVTHHLEMTTNNMGQTFGREKHFHVHTTLKPFSSNNINHKKLGKTHKLSK
jgi:hypothetical protein